MYQTILVPHEGTSVGDKALKHAINASTDKSRIIILHIVESIPYPPSFALSSSERKSLQKSINQANEEIKNEMQREMEKRSEQCKKNKITSKIVIDIGDASEIILNVIKKEKVDLVVMAKRRKLKGIKKLLSLGSVSRKIVENSTCPILLLDGEK